MVQVIANDAVRVLLEGLKETAEIRDEKGGLVGYFLPAASEEALLRQKVLAEYDPAETARRKASGEKGHTTAEVLERLRSPGRT
jgi:hypothetical protein